MSVRDWTLPGVELSTGMLRMGSTPVSYHVDEWWRVPQDDLEDILHRLEVAPWYADHGVASVYPFFEQHTLLEARSDFAVHKADMDKPKLQARKAASNAISAGELVRPLTCSGCGREAKVEGHHADYSRPLDLEWLCRPCHARRHCLLRSAA